MGVVYRATQLSLDRQVALKIMAGALASDAEARRRFVQEGKLASRVSHQHLVKVIDVGEADGTLYLAYELIRGETLRTRLDREGRLGLEETLDLGRQCADALATL